MFIVVVFYILCLVLFNPCSGVCFLVVTQSVVYEYVCMYVRTYDEYDIQLIYEAYVAKIPMKY